MASAQPIDFSVRHWTTADGLPSHSINTIVEGPEGYLWLTSQGGVVRFDGHRFTVLGELHGLRGNRFHSLFLTAAGQLLVSGADGGLYRLEQSRFHRIADGLIVRMMGETADGTLWGANTVQRARLSAEGEWRDHTPTSTFPEVDGVTRFVRSGNILDFTAATRVLQPATGMQFRSRRLGDRVIVEADSGGKAYDVPGSPVPELRFVDRDGLLWVTDGGRARAFRSGSTSPVATLVLPDVDRINDLYQSADGQLWFGTETAGLFGARRSPTRVIGRAQGTTSDQVSSIGERPDGRITLSDRNGAYYTLADGESALRPESQPGYVFTDAQGTEWFLNTRVEPHALETRAGDRIALPELMAVRPRLSQDRSPAQGLWIAGRDWAAHFVPGRGSDPFVSVHRGLRDVAAIAAVAPGEALVLSQGGLLRATNAGLLLLVAREDLPPGELRALHVGQDGTVWVGGYGGGLVRVRDGVVRRFTTADGLTENIVAAIIDDGRGGLWTAGNRGIQWVALRDLEARSRGKVPAVLPVTLTRENDLSNPESSGWPAHRASDGRLWFPTFGGAVVVDPSLAVNPDAPAPRVLIEGVTANGAPMNGPEFAVPAGDRRLVFTYTGVALESANQVRFQHRLDGVDNTWIDAGTARAATYTDVPPGSLRFLVRATRGSAWSEPAVATIIVEPFWWETRWAMAAAMLALVAVALVAGRVRASRLRQRAVMLEHEVAARTRELQAEQKTVAAQAEELRRLDRARSQFFANISHEFRTPLTLIQGPLIDLADGIHGPLPERARQLMGLATANTGRLLRLVDQLLDLSKADSGRLSLQAREIDLALFVRTVCEAFDALARRSDVSFRLVTPPAAVLVWVDPDHLEKVVVNLVANAIKYSNPGGQVEVEVSEAPAPATAVMLRVTDTGVGIAAADQPYIFERYFRGQSGTTDREGTGIGLALTRELVLLHHGTIVVDSEVGCGSTFVVTLPRGREHLRPDELAPAAQTPEAESGGGAAVPTPEASSALSSDPDQCRTVLIADDSPDIRQYLRQSLSGRFRVVEAVDGAQALEMIPPLMPDLVISDVMMPGLDGVSLCRAIKANPETAFVPVILLTAKASLDSRVGGLEGGADDYLVKPFSLRELTARIDNLIDQRRRWLARYGGPPPVVADRPAEPLSDDERFLQRLRAAIEARIGEERLQPETLAGDLGMSRATLYRRTQQAAGRSPADLIWDVRLERAAALLAAPDSPVAEVAYGLGFTSLSHFSRRFREAYGKSPTAWRELRRSGQS